MEKSKYEIIEMADILHQTSSLYLASNIPIDYGTGEKYTAVEVHTLKYIIDHPGKTNIELAKEWDKTKVAISLMLKKMEEKNLIYKENSLDNKKKQLYYATLKGIELNKAHLEYDAITFGNTMNFVKEICSDEEITTCFYVLEQYIKARRKKHYRSPKNE